MLLKNKNKNKKGGEQRPPIWWPMEGSKFGGL
jgi:hypothetical protein